MLWLGLALSALAPRSLLDQLSWPGRSAGGKADRSRLFELAASDLFSDPAGVRRLGRRYLSLHPGEGDLAGFGRQLERRLRDHHALDSPEAVGRALAAEIRRDFARGRVVLVDGWVVSLLEARLCALCTAA